MKTIALIVGIISVAIIAFQLSLMRILSVIQFHHFAYMIISVALLGFGAAGTFLSIFRERALKYFDTVIFLASFFCSLTILLSTVLIHYLRFEPFLIFWELSAATSLLLFYFAILLPFFFGAVVICLSFMKYSEYIGEIYFYNLFGSALGGVCTIGLMWWLDPLTLPYTVALLSLISAFLGFKYFHLNRKYIIPLFLILIIIIYGFVNPITLRVSEYKSLSKTLNIPDAKITDERISPMAKLTTVESSVLRYAPGLSYSFTGEIPVQVGLFSDGEWVGTILKDNISEKTDFLNSTTSALPYHLFRKDTIHPEVLVIGAGTGTEIRLASQNGAKKITGIELNPQIIEITEKYLKLSDRGYGGADINFIAAEGRGYLNQAEQKYDVISIPILEGWTASAAGMYSLHENYLFTVESINLMLQRLNDRGVLAITCWLNNPPRHAIKLFATLVEAAEKMSIKNPEKHIAAIRSWGTTTLIFKKSHLNTSNVSALRKFCNDKYFDAIYFPGISSEETNIYNQLDDDYFFKSAVSILSNNRKDFYDEYIFNVQPSSDNKPYFSHFLKLKSFKFLIEEFNKESVSSTAFLELGFVVLLITFFQIVGISILLIIVPLLFFKKKVTTSAKFRTLIYFAGLGIGFMFIEIVMIQKFILFLSHPVYSVSVVITSLLLFSGIGSWFSHRIFISRRHKLQIIIGSLVVITLIYNFILPMIFNSLIHYPFIFKYIVSILLIAPQAFFMGMPFPLGLKKISENSATLVPWAWGINGCLSVISAVAVPLIAMEFGFNAVILIATFSYAGAAIVGIKFKG